MAGHHQLKRRVSPWLTESLFRMPLFPLKRESFHPCLVQRVWSTNVTHCSKLFAVSVQNIYAYMFGKVLPSLSAFHSHFVSVMQYSFWCDTRTVSEWVCVTHQAHILYLSTSDLSESRSWCTDFQVQKLSKRRHLYSEDRHPQTKRQSKKNVCDLRDSVCFILLYLLIFFW